MIQNFEEAVFKLDTVGQISEVLTTSYGYHIIKLLEKESIKSFEEEKAMLKSQISNSARATKSRKSVIEKLKKEYNAKINLEALDPFYSLVTDSLFSGTWNPEEALALNGELLSFGDVVYTQSDFARFIDTRNRKQQPQNVRTFIDQSFDNFVDKKIVAYEQAGLEEKYPQFYYLMKEYHDGILLFELTDQMVWSKAITDTVGLEAFYQANKENYWWDKRYEVANYKCNNEKSAKYLQKKLKKERDWTWIDDHCNKKDSAAVKLIDTGKYLKGQNTLVDQVIIKSGLEDKSDGYKVMQNDNNVVVTIKLIPPAQKTLKDARGMVTADYQNLLEKQWIKQLRDKYTIIVHKDVLETIAE
jgi:peptidyl-prolyl cis-trans isomerase SurA